MRIASFEGAEALKGSAALTGGLVGNAGTHAVFPTPSALHSLLLSLLAMTPALLKLARRPSYTSFLETLVFASRVYLAEFLMLSGWLSTCRYTSLCGFMFGFHVHEKAILHVTIPMSLLAFQQPDKSMRQFHFLSSVGCLLGLMPNLNCLSTFSCTSQVALFSLFPLLFEQREYPVKLLLALLQVFCVPAVLKSPFTKEDAMQRPLLAWFEQLFVAGLFVLEFYSITLHSVLFGKLLDGS